MKTARDHRNSTALGRGLVGIVAATIFVSTLTLLSTEASALDINGLAAMALNYARNHGGYRVHHSGTQTAPRCDRDSDDADDQDSSDYDRKSAGTGVVAASAFRGAAVGRSVGDLAGGHHGVARPAAQRRSGIAAGALIFSEMNR